MLLRFQFENGGSIGWQYILLWIKVGNKIVFVHSSNLPISVWQEMLFCFQPEKAVMFTHHGDSSDHKFTSACTAMPAQGPLLALSPARGSHWKVIAMLSANCILIYLGSGSGSGVGVQAG